MGCGSSSASKAVHPSGPANPLPKKKVGKKPRDVDSLPKSQTKANVALPASKPKAQLDTNASAQQQPFPPPYSGSDKQAHKTEIGKPPKISPREEFDKKSRAVSQIASLQDSWQESDSEEERQESYYEEEQQEEKEHSLSSTQPQGEEARANVRAPSPPTPPPCSDRETDSEAETEVSRQDTARAASGGHLPAQETYVAAASSAAKKLKKLNVNLSLYRKHVRRDVIVNVIEELGWTETDDEHGPHLLWLTTTAPEHLCTRLRRSQRLNHFPGMHQLGHKCNLARLIADLRQELPELFDFHPESFNLPAERDAFEKRIAHSGRDPQTFIVKPDDGACGNGIFLTRSASAVPRTLPCVAQRYIDNPMLIDGRKFDLRLYVLVTSVEPLRAYLHHAGLARFASDKYARVTEANINDTFMHLTNFSVNKHHPDFQVIHDVGEKSGAPVSEEAAEAVGGKRSAAWVRLWIAKQGFDVAAVWREVEEVLVKTLLAAAPLVSQAYKTCVSEFRSSGGTSSFEVLGFDVMFDADAKPWLIEVNVNPSMETSTPLDVEVKQAVLKEALQMVCPTQEECRLISAPTLAVPIPGASQQSSAACAQWREQMAALRVEQEASYARGFRPIYPSNPPPPSARPAAHHAPAPLHAQAAGWAFLGTESDEGAAQRGRAYAECLAAAEQLARTRAPQPGANRR